MLKSVLDTNNVFEKLRLVEGECHLLLKGDFEPSRKDPPHDRISVNKNSLLEKIFSVPESPARDLTILPNNELSARVGLQSPKGQAQLLHDLANIELQAMELGLRTLHEFPNAPSFFREELAEIVIEEGQHLKLCLDGIEQLGFKWGDWPCHLNLWNATSSKNSLLDRIFVVHCYLEGSGLDSGEAILTKLSGVTNKTPRTIVATIAREEVDHVKFGLKWFRTLSGELKLEPSTAFENCLKNLRNQLPKRSAKISREVRRKVGFSESEIHALEKFATVAP